MAADTGAMSRRGFLLAAAAALAAGAQWMITRRLGAPRLPAPPPAPPAESMALTRPAFAARVGHSFQVRGHGVDGRDLTLAAVRDLPAVCYPRHAANPDEARCRSFSLLFVGDAGRPLAQGTYDFAGLSDGPTPIFIVPMGPGPDGQRYEAVFNRL